MKNINDKLTKNGQNMPNFVPPVIPTPTGIPTPMLSTAPEHKNKTGLNNPIVRSIVEQEPSATDPTGSYTGRPINKNETPVQDADDL